MREICKTVSSYTSRDKLNQTIKVLKPEAKGKRLDFLKNLESELLIYRKTADTKFASEVRAFEVSF